MNSIFYLSYLFATLVLGSFVIGPFSIRVYMNVIMTIYLVSTKSNNRATHNKKLHFFIIGYLTFILITTLTLLITGEFFSYNFSKYLMAFLFPSVVLIFATRRYVTNEQSLKIVFAFLLSIVALDSISTILQSYSPTLGMLLGSLFNNSAEAQTNISELVDIYEKIGENTGYGFAGGIFGYAFANSLFLSTVGFYSFYFLQNKRRTPLRLFYWFLLLIAIYSCLLTQERVSFVTMLIAVAYLLFIYSSSANGIGVLSIVVIFGLFFLNMAYFSSYNWGRVFQISMEDDSRNAIWASAIDFLSNNLFFGGPATYFAMYPDKPPHNFFLNSFIISGLLGGIIISVLFIWIMCFAIKNVLNRKKEEMSMVMLSVSVLVSFAYSMFHNSGLHNGSAIIVLVVTLMLCKTTIKGSNVL